MAFSKISSKKIESTREAACILLYELHEKKEDFTLNVFLEKQSLYFNQQEMAQLLAYFYGSLTHLPALDYWISLYAERSLDKVHPFLLNCLRLGTWQIAYGHQRKEANVNEVVKIVKKYLHTGAVAFTNAVLRKISQNNLEIPSKRLDLKYGLPSYLLGYLKKNVNASDLEMYLQRLQSEMPLYINYCGDEEDREAFEEAFKGENVDFERLHFSSIYQKTPFSILKDAYRLNLNKNALKNLSNFKKGLFYVQGLASQLTSSVLPIQSGQSVLDVCAAPGGKSLSAMKNYYRQLSKTTAKPVSFYLADVSVKRLERIKENFERIYFLKTDLAKRNLLYQTFQQDACSSASLFSEKPLLFDHVICDVPCSCLGLLRSKLELRVNMTHEKIQALLPIQAEILKKSASKVKAGGYLLYSTCTINKQENEDQIERFLNEPEGQHFQKMDLSERLPFLSKGTYHLRLDFPHYESEGFYICLLKNNEHRVGE